MSTQSKLLAEMSRIRAHVEKRHGQLEAQEAKDFEILTALISGTLAATKRAGVSRLYRWIVFTRAYWAIRDYAKYWGITATN